MYTNYCVSYYTVWVTWSTKIIIPVTRGNRKIRRKKKRRRKKKKKKEEKKKNKEEEEEEKLESLHRVTPIGKLSSQRRCTQVSRHIAPCNRALMGLVCRRMITYYHNPSYLIAQWANKAPPSRNFDQWQILLMWGHIRPFPPIQEEKNYSLYCKYQRSRLVLLRKLHFVKNKRSVR